MKEQCQVLKAAGVGLALLGWLAWCSVGRCPGAIAHSRKSTRLAQREKSSAAAWRHPLTFSSAVAMLANDRWRVRSRAQSFLMQESPSRLPLVLHDLRQTHSAEQARRLLKVALQLYLMARTPTMGGPVPFLGVEYNMQALRVRLHGQHKVCAAAIVMGILPGFPAAAVLRSTDMIIGINGRIFPRWMTANAFRRAIQGFKPGDLVRLMVVRGRGVVAVPVRLVGVAQGAGQLGEWIAQRRAAAVKFVARYSR